MMRCTMTCVGYWYFCTVLLTLWMISVTKQMEAAEAMFVAEVFRTRVKIESFTGQWRLLSAWRAMLELHLSLRTGSLRSWNNLCISFRETGTAVHMIFRQNFVVPGHWFSPKKVMVLCVRAATVIPAQAGCCCCCCWQPQRLLICNSWFFKLNNTHQSETLHSKKCNFV